MLDCSKLCQKHFILGDIRSIFIVTTDTGTTLAHFKILTSERRAKQLFAWKQTTHLSLFSTPNYNICLLLDLTWWTILNKVAYCGGIGIFRVGEFLEFSQTHALLLRIESREKTVFNSLLLFFMLMFNFINLVACFDWAWLFKTNGYSPTLEFY